MKSRVPISIELQTASGENVWHIDAINPSNAHKYRILHLTVHFDFNYMGQKYHASGDVDAVPIDNAQDAVVAKIATTGKEANERQ